MIDIDKLKKDATKIHYFGLGFIQVKLGPEHRMHFYYPELPAITPEEDVHNHRYDFFSTVLGGELIQDLYTVVKGDTHVLEQESCNPDRPCQSTTTPCGIRLMARARLKQGSDYGLSHETFHRVRPGKDGCITLITRGPIEKDLADVVHTVNAEKVCPFSKKIDEKELWEIVETMVRRF